MENPRANNEDTERSHYVASNLGLHCLSITFYWFPRKNELKLTSIFKETFYHMDALIC